MRAGLAALSSSGELAARIEALKGMMSPCRLCPRRCGADRAGGETGFCNAGAALEVASVVIHGGEEPVLGGETGVGNVFLAHCNLRCRFCQNIQISQTDRRFPMEPARLASKLLELQEAGCPTLGFVSPTHFVPGIAEAVALAAEAGMDRPLVYNSNGYDSVEVLKLLEGIFDIYLPDFKYWGEEEAVRCSDAPGYPAAAVEALREMYRQTGLLRTDSRGIAERGLIVRHLVLPNDLSGTRGVLEAIARELSPQVAISLMSQYNPLHGAMDDPLLSRRLREREYLSAAAVLEELGFTEGWTQDWKESPAAWLPDFDRDGPPFES